MGFADENGSKHSAIAHPTRNGNNAKLTKEPSEVSASENSDSPIGIAIENIKQPVGDHHRWLPRPTPELCRSATTSAGSEADCCRTDWTSCLFVESIDSTHSIDLKYPSPAISSIAYCRWMSGIGFIACWPGSANSYRCYINDFSAAMAGA